MDFGYASYTWHPGEQDPICDSFRTALEERFGRGDLMRKGAYEIARRTNNVTAGAMIKWLDGSTISPRFFKIAAALGAIGYELKMVKMAGAKVIKFEKRRLGKRAIRGQQHETARRRTA